jgi:hypothetical protein
MAGKNGAGHNLDIFSEYCYVKNAPEALNMDNLSIQKI